jgi:hypothetical protein
MARTFRRSDEFAALRNNFDKRQRFVERDNRRAERESAFEGFGYDTAPTPRPVKVRPSRHWEN